MEKKFTYLFLIAIVLYGMELFGQNAKIDSLKQVLKIAKEDTSKVKILNNLSWELFNIGNYDACLLDANNAKDLASKLNFKKGLGRAYMIIGIVYSSQGNYPDALKIYFISLHIFEEIGNKKGKASSYTNIGSVFYIQGNYPEALKNYFAALKIREEIGDKDGISACYNNIGNIYNSQGNYNEALKNHFAALKMREEIGDKNGIAASYGNIGNVNSNQGKYTEALENHSAALRIREETGNKQGMSVCYNNIGNVYFKENKYSEALKSHFTALKITEEIGDKQGIETSFGNIGSVNYKLKNYRDAEIYSTKALTLAKEIGTLDIIKDANKNLSDVYTATGRHALALLCFKAYIIARDSLINEENTKKTVQAQMNFDFEKKEGEAKAVQERKDLKAQDEKQKQTVIRNSFIGGFALVLILAIVVLRSYRQKQKANKELEGKNLLIAQQKYLVEEKHKEITDSINYAERIQRSFLATKNILDEHLIEYFVFFRPKDIVSGDFYWASELNNGNFVLVTADSTGHGVPGAIMSILNISSLEKSTEQKLLTAPNEILNHTRIKIIERLKKDGSSEGGKDGMDCSLISFDFKNSQLQIANANSPVWIVRGNEVIEIKADKMPVGKHDKEKEPFTLKTVNVNKGDVVYTLTDGFPDQFGGEKGKKFMSKNLKELLSANCNLPMEEQKQLLQTTFNNWIGDLEQVDDVTIIGVRIKNYLDA